MSDVDPEYLAAAREAGQLRELDGLPYVAGSYVEPVTDEKQCFVEYADRGLLGDETLPRLAAQLMDEHPQAQRLLLRAPGELILSGPWRPQLTYVSHDVASTAAPTSAIVPARPQDQPLIIGWLARAFTTAGASFGGQADAAGVWSLAQQVFDGPDRVTLVYLLDEVAVGHATLLCEAHDPVSGEDFVELLDILVEPEFDVRGITRELVAASAIRARQLGRRLIGNVVHPAALDDETGARVVASLCRSGWSVAYRYWQRGIDPEG